MKVENRWVWDVEEWIWDKVEWWDREDFQGRVTRLYSGDTLGELASAQPEVLPVPDEVIVCDFCNEDITEFPCPVWRGHALCSECRRRVKLAG